MEWKKSKQEIITIWDIEELEVRYIIKLSVPDRYIVVYDDVLQMKSGKAVIMLKGDIEKMYNIKL